jgi:hypothetical protein
LFVKIDGNSGEWKKGKDPFDVKKSEPAESAPAPAPKRKLAAGGGPGPNDEIPFAPCR